MEYKLRQPINQQYRPIEQVLYNRGINYEDIIHYLNVTKQDNLNPTLLTNINEAIKILIKHLSTDNSIINIIVDSDCDGYCASALMLNYIYARWPSAVNRIKYILHDSKAHGIELDKLSKDIALLLVPDAGSNEYTIHKTLQDRGVDIIVLDHHQAPKLSEYACVVNNQLCDYPNKSLCGCGIVYKFCQQIDELLGDQGFVDQFLDIVAVSNVADMMDLRSFETHYLVQEGLQYLSNPFIKGMAEKNILRRKHSEKSAFIQKTEETITPFDVAFFIAPLVNCITRVGTLEEKTIVFRSMLTYEANKIVASTKRGHKGEVETVLEQALRVCTNVKNRQTKDQDKAVELVEKRIQQQNLTSHKIIIVKLEVGEINTGITGLIANKIMAKYQQPVLLLTRTISNDKYSWNGSGRSPSKCVLTDLRKFCEESNLVVYAQGHASAFGVAILDENLQQFIEYSDEKLREVTFSPIYQVDFIYSPEERFHNDVLSIGGYNNLWGQEIEEPLIVIENVLITRNNISFMSPDKNPAIKINLKNGIDCVKFKASQEEFDKLRLLNGCTYINILGKCNINKWNGQEFPQIIIEDYEIISTQEFYF